MFLDPALRSNTPYDLTQDRIKLNADYRGLEGWKLSGGYDWDRRQRNYTEAVKTEENTLWGRAGWQAMEALALNFNLAWADRSSSTYGTSIWVSSPQNPQMRKFNLAPRERVTAGARGDWTVADGVTFGLGADWAKDDYDETVIGLQEAETGNVVADITWAISDTTRVFAFAQAERTESRQTGSQSFGNPDWTGTVKDRVEAYGLGIKHAAIPDKLDLGADLTFSRSRSETTTQTVLAEPAFPTARTSLDVFKLYADYRLNDRLSLVGSYWYESYDGADWRLDGVTPSTVFNFLAFGNQAPRYNVSVFRVAVRYRF
jgi:MtrB/PioB family decaheme-associated outer membrane protein